MDEQIKPVIACRKGAMESELFQDLSFIEAKYADESLVDFFYPQSAIDALRAEVEDLRENGAKAVRWAPSSCHWSVELARLFGPDARDGIAALESQLREAEALRAEVERLKLRDAQMRDAAMMLMAERDADRARIAHLAAEPVIEGFVALDKDFYEHAMDAAEDAGREEPNDDDLLDGMRRLLDAAIDAAKKGAS